MENFNRTPPHGDGTLAYNPPPVKQPYTPTNFTSPNVQPYVAQWQSWADVNVTDIVYNINRNSNINGVVNGITGHAQKCDIHTHKSIIIIEMNILWEV